MPIYTRTGDKGQTSLFDGTRVLKSHVRVKAYGTIDELNSAIGVAISHCKKKAMIEIREELKKIQNDLLDIGSALAFPEALPVIGLDTRIHTFEKLIDTLTESMPPLNNFIHPGGSTAGSFLHVARTITRRAERNIVLLMQTEAIDEQIVKYVNRLSDLLFTMARKINYLEKQEELIWVKK